MQTSLETIGQLERRLNMAVPLAEIESEVDKRLKRLAKNVKIAGFRPGKVPMKMVLAAVRRPGALRRHLRRAAVDVQRRDPRAEPAGRRQSAHRAAPGRVGAGPARVLGDLRGLPGGPRRRSLRRRHRAARRGRRSRQTSTTRSTCCASSAPLRTREPARGERRSRDRRFHGTDRRRGIPRRAGEGFRDRHRRGGDAARVRGRRDGHCRRRDEDLRPHVPGRLPRQGSCG